ncbi:cysteate synthase [Halosquirtibacter xylanolyticus]|uniref:cysteate synthase n=1 Tax=Halosquirtibacter xylanolyticus TaxID=3374599 RepID=UPI003748F372|nr:cysteate synthase [Prolixibacteraceae bacterium]
MVDFKKTEYHLKSLCCDACFEDKNWVLDHDCDCGPSLIQAVYKEKQISIHNNHPGLYKFSDWLPIQKTLPGAGSPFTYKSEALAQHLGLSNLYVTFSGYWPERGGDMKSGSFKECEAYCVTARGTEPKDKILVVASAGNTARAFARVCSENKIPLLLCIPEDNINALYFDHELDPCVKVVAAASGGDYYDAIHISNVACSLPEYYAEGGAKNVARRDGMATTVYSAITTIGEIPSYYFQAVGSGTGAIAAWEAVERFKEDGRFGSNNMKLLVSQNEPFVPIQLAWRADSRSMLPQDDDQARRQVEEIDAKVLSNRKPPYGLTGGLYDALKATDGDVLTASNEEGAAAGELFEKLEGIDIEPASAIALATLIKEVPQLDKDALIMLNITGGGKNRFHKDHKIFMKKPDMVIPIGVSDEEIIAHLNGLIK